MSSEWQTVAIGSLCLGIFDGPHATPKKTSSGPIFLGISSLNNGQLDLSTTEHLSEDDFVKWTKRVVPQAGDIVFSYETRIGQVAVIPEGLRCCLGRRMALMRVDPSKIISDYLLYAYLSPEFQETLRKRTVHGSTVDRISLIEFGSFPISVPPLDVQKEVVGTLRALDDRITLLRETNATLEAIAQALFKSWFVDFDPVRAKAEGLEPEGMDAATSALFPDSFADSELGLVPMGWKVARLGDVTKRITKGTTPTTLKRPFVESGINFVKAESLTDDGQFLPDKFAYIDDETHQLLSRSQLKAGDVLITIAGTIGRVAVMTDDFIPANTNQAVALVRPEFNGFPSVFISHFLRLTGSKAQMGEKVVQAVQANLSLGSLSNMRLVIPPADVVKKLHEVVFGVVESNKNANQRRIRTLTQLRDILLPRLISGQLRLPEAEAQIEAVCA
ncbi:restriction endonuclease subunit S [Pseudomonas rhodesiae]|uniref:restriction endonuclease subunit S n=1 Tax=Pseudomonas rhodesiae TaxID=76760 RepID=UPI00156AC18B|nr:restriction endonuclease subunit S [Pseudomonas rhodesiae]QKJ75341.1 restriction endonuclease subunit S [Pseudomonas rhodesiae]